MLTVTDLLSRFPFPVALSILRPDSERGIVLPVANFGEQKRIFPWKSITKLATSRLILAAVENGVLGWETDYWPLIQEIQSDWGGNYQLVKPIDKPSRLQLTDLLGHSSGLPVEGASPYHQVGTSEVKTWTIVPGQKRLYSNYAYELLGEILYRCSGISYGQWLHTMLIAPLGLELYLGQSPAAQPGLPSEIRTDSPAWGLHSDLRNLARFAQECISPAYLSSRQQARWLTPVNPGLAGIVPGFGRQKDCQWGNGPEIKAEKGRAMGSKHWMAPMGNPQTWGHFGQSGSFLWWDPQAQVGAVFLGAEAFGTIHQELWPQLNQQIQQEYL